MRPKQSSHTLKPVLEVDIVAVIITVARKLTISIGIVALMVHVVDYRIIAIDKPKFI